MQNYSTRPSASCHLEYGGGVGAGDPDLSEKSQTYDRAPKQYWFVSPEKSYKAAKPAFKDADSNFFKFSQADMKRHVPIWLKTC